MRSYDNNRCTGAADCEVSASFNRPLNKTKIQEQAEQAKKRTLILEKALKASKKYQISLEKIVRGELELVKWK